MRQVRFGLLLLMVAAAQSCAVGAASAQAVICCIEIIDVQGDWFGAIRLNDCQDYFNRAPLPVLRQMCRYTGSLSCIDTERCRELPPEPPARNPPGGGGTSPPDPDRDGLADGFRGPAPVPPASEPPTGGVSPPRLAYLVPGSPGAPEPGTSFTVYLDRAGCPLPLADDHRPSDRTAAAHVVRGRIVRGDGRTRVDAESSDLLDASKRGPRAGAASGEGAAAVASATRSMLKQLDLVCAGR